GETSRRRGASVAARSSRLLPFRVVREIHSEFSRVPANQIERMKMFSITLKKTVITAIAACLALPSLAPAGMQVPFQGTWSGQTVSAIPVDFNPTTVVAIVSAGEGQATHLGHYTMVSPHFSHLLTGAVDGTQVFEAANGDTVTAEFTGQFTPTPDGLLFGVI